MPTPPDLFEDANQGYQSSSDIRRGVPQRFAPNGDFSGRTAVIRPLRRHSSRLSPASRRLLAHAPLLSARSLLLDRHCAPSTSTNVPATVRPEFQRGGRGEAFLWNARKHLTSP